MLWVEWHPCSFRILILGNGSAWNGHASDDHVQQFSRLLQLSVEDYMNETKSALSTYGGSTDYTYLVKDGQFVWKKLDQCSRVRMKYGYIQLEETVYHEAAEVMLDCLLQHCSNLKTEVVNLQTNNTAAKRERTVLMEKLVQYKTEKLEMEKQLSGQFLAVLNAKKEYIQQLEERLHVGSEQPLVTQSSTQKPVQQDSSQCHYDSDTETETTDDERKVDFSFLSDTDDLFTDDKTTLRNIPKLINLRKRLNVEAVAGPSSRKVSGGTVASGHDEQFSTQDMLDDM